MIRVSRCSRTDAIVTDGNEMERAQGGIPAQNAERFDALRLVIERRRWADEIRRSQLERSRKRLGTLRQDQMEVIDATTAVIVKKLLHTPIVQIRQLARDGDGAGVIGLVRKLLDMVAAAAASDRRVPATHSLGKGSQ